MKGDSLCLLRGCGQAVWPALSGDEGAWPARPGLSTAPVRGPAVHLCVAAGPGDSRRPPQVVRGLREWPGAGVKQGVNEGGSSW